MEEAGLGLLTRDIAHLPLALPRLALLLLLDDAHAEVSLRLPVNLAATNLTELRRLVVDQIRSHFVRFAEHLR